MSSIHNSHCGTAAEAAEVQAVVGEDVSASITPAPPEPARKVNFIAALLLCWLMPGRYGPHVSAGSWRRALSAQVLGIGLGLTLAGIGTLITEAERPLSLEGIRAMMAWMVLETVHETAGLSTAWLIGGLAAAVLGFELLLVLLALLFMPWAADGDSLPSAFKRSLKNAWWWTTVAIPAGVVTAIIINYEGLMEDAIHRFEEISSPLIISFVYCAAGVLVAWLLVRPWLSGAGRYVGQAVGPGFEERDLVCEDCGYQLRGLPVTGRCPECGLAVETSLPGGRRQLIPWQRGKLGWRAGLELLRMQWRVLFERDFFKKLPTDEPIFRAQVFWWWTWLLMIVAVEASMKGSAIIALIFAADGNVVPRRWGEEFIVVFTMMASLLFLAQILTLWVTCWRTRVQFGTRNWRPVTATVLYAAPTLWLLVLGAAALFALAFFAEEFGWHLRFHLGRYVVDQGLLTAMAVLTWFALGLLFWWWRLVRALRAVRFANS